MAAGAPWEQLAQHTDWTTGACAGGGATAASLSGNGGSERLARATRAMRLGDWQAAARLLTLEAEEQPDSWLALDLRAACWLQEGRYEQALDDAMLCTKLSPDWARGWARLGTAQLCLSHPRAAAAAYRQGLGLDPGNREMQLGLELAQAAQAAQAGRRKAMRH